MKKIVLLSDGTGNGAGKKNQTNVSRLYSALDLHQIDQIAMYSDGVGSQQFLPFKILGGAFGWGLKRNVIELYKFLCRNYVTDGTKAGSDKIYLFGFSRGAFAVRVLAGLIAKCGLITGEDSERNLHKKALHNYSVYRNRYKRRYPFALFTYLNGRKTPYNMACPKPDIEFIGVWDTVAAYGLPFDELMVLWDKFIYPMSLPTQRLNKKVIRAYHAVSIDDERHTFHPILWDESKKIDRDRIEQVWFPGVHSDVGGGYPRYELSLVPLDWMISKAEAEGLNFIPTVRDEYRYRRDWHGIQHDSRAGIAAYYRYKPRNIKHLCNQCTAEKTRVTISDPKIHRSTFERVRAKVVPYAPTGLPEDYKLVSTRNEVQEREDNSQKEARVAAMNGALDVIYWRRWLYRAFLATTVMLVASPLFLKWVACAPCTGVVSLLNPLFDYFRSILPNFVADWIDALLTNPVWFLIFAVLYLLLSKLKHYAYTETLTRATAAWYAQKNSTKPLPWSPTITGKLREISDSEGFQKFRNFLWKFVFVFILVVVVMVTARVLFHVRDSAGWLCKSSSTTSLATNQVSIEFDTDNPCLPTKVVLAAGRTYQFKVQTKIPWTDGELPAEPDGLKNDSWREMRFFIPLRRHILRPWYELTGRVGHSGRETFAIGSGVRYTARSDGELYLYVNDAVFGFLPGPYWALPYFWLAGPNIGNANITVTPVELPP